MSAVGSSCQFCLDRAKSVDFKDVDTLASFLDSDGKIKARALTGNCIDHQRQIAKAIKRARELGIISFARAD